MMSRSALYSAQWVIPVDGPPVCDGALLVDGDGRIERVATTASFELSDDVARVDFGAAAILPGLINVHAHPELAAFRGLLEDLPFHLWIPTLMRCKQNAQLTEDDFEVAARWTCVEALRAGITTIGATEESGAAVSACATAGMRGLVFLEVFGPDPAQAPAAIAALRDRIAQHARAAPSRVRLGVSPHAPYSVSDELFARVAELARTDGLPVATHAAEAEAEELLVREAAGPFAAGLRSRGIATAPRGRSTVDLLRRTGIMDCAPLLIHAVRASHEDLRMAADAGAAIAHCPIANARLGHGIAPIVEAIEMGITVAVGTDSVASNNRMDLLEEAHVAQVLQRARLQSASALASEQLLRLVTIDAARALGMSAEIGTLSSGKWADFCVVSLASANTVPAVDPLPALFHAARASDVVLTAVAGQPLFRDDRVLTLTEAELGPRIEATAQRLHAAKLSA